MNAREQINGRRVYNSYFPFMSSYKNFAGRHSWKELLSTPLPFKPHGVHRSTDESGYEVSSGRWSVALNSGLLAPGTIRFLHFGLFPVAQRARLTCL